jgi:hypothetical protein
MQAYRGPQTTSTFDRQRVSGGLRKVISPACFARWHPHSTRDPFLIVTTGRTSPGVRTILVVMGVSGSGETTLAKALAASLGWQSQTRCRRAITTWNRSSAPILWSASLAAATGQELLVFFVPLAQVADISCGQHRAQLPHALTGGLSVRCSLQAGFGCLAYPVRCYDYSITTRRHKLSKQAPPLA